MIKKKLFDFKEVWKFFGFANRQKNKPTLENIDFEIFSGDRICFVGKNGAGKTTFLGLITKLIYPTSGKMYYDKSSFNGKNINFLFQESEFPINLKVKKLLKILKSSAKDLAYFNFLYEMLNLEDFLENKLYELSGGEKQKFNLFQVLLTKPQILVLDEYSNHLDMPTFKQLSKIIFDYAEKHSITILMSSHKKREIENLCKSVIVLKNGKIEKIHYNSKGFSLRRLNQMLDYQKKEKEE